MGYIQFKQQTATEYISRSVISENQKKNQNLSTANGVHSLTIIWNQTTTQIQTFQLLKVHQLVIQLQKNQTTMVITMIQMINLIHIKIKTLLIHTNISKNGKKIKENMQSKPFISKLQMR